MTRTTAALLLCLIPLSLNCITHREYVTKAPIPLIEIPRAGIPVVSIQVLVKSGSADDPAGKEGLAQFTANLMTRSTAKFSRSDIEDRLQYLGARLEVKVDRETTLFSCQTLRESLDQAYEILSDIVLNPTFPESEMAELKSGQMEHLEDIVRDDSRLCLAVFQAILYGNHSYAHPVQGIQATIRSFTPQDADSYYRSNFRSNNIVLGVAGDYPAGFAERMRSDFGALIGGTVRKSRGSPVPLSGRKVVLVEKENRAQTHFRIGNIATYDRNSPDYYSILVAGTYLGQHRESFSRLFKVIRKERGLAYRACSYPEHFEQVGWSKLPHPLVPWSPTYYSIWSYPKAANAEFTIKLALDELSNLIEHGIPQADLVRMKQFTVNHFAFLHETPAKLLGLEMEQLYYGDSSYIVQYPHRVSQVTAADVAAAVRKYWSADDWLLVAVVSDGQRFKEELLDGQTAVEYPQGTSDTDLEARDEQVKRLDLGLTDGDITIVKASGIFK